MKLLKKIAYIFINLLKGNVRAAFNSFGFLTAFYSFCIHLFNKTKQNSRNKVAVFYMEDGIKDRYIFSIINAYKIAGYDIFLKPKYSFYKGCSGLYILNIFTYLNIGYLSSFKKTNRYKYKIFITDVPNAITPLGFDKYLTIDYKLAFENYKLTLPFPFHPLIYIDNKLLNQDIILDYLYPLRNTEKNIKIIFGGAVFGDTYNNIKNHFSCLLTRNEIFTNICNKFSEKINKTTEINDNFPITIIDTSKKYIIQHKDWMNFIKKASFFIAPPGFEMPFSHNVIEAMACGVIPIIQYNNYFTPKLVHEVNCLVFNKIEELENVINQALNMSDSNIERMKENVINYYNNNLSPICYVKKTEKTKLSNIKISIISGAFSLK